MVGATKVASKGKTNWNVAPIILTLLIRPHFMISVDLVEGLIKRACKHKRLLSKQFTNN